MALVITQHHLSKPCARLTGRVMLPALKFSLDGFQLRDHTLLGRNPPDGDSSRVIVAAILEGMTAGSGQISAEETRKMVDEVRGQRGDTLRHAGVIHLLYEYRGVPNDQLSAYASMLASPLAVRFNAAAESGLPEATRQASAELMRAMMQRYPVKVPPVGKN
jgi:hypothetical protein